MEYFLMNHYNTSMILLRDLMISLTPYYKKEARISQFNQEVTVQLFTSLYSTSECVLVLVREYGIFEADSLLRSVLEGTAKYLYMMSGDLEKDSEVIKEYYYTIPEMQKISEHYKAKKVIEIQRLFNTRKNPIQLSILDESILSALQEKYSNKLRKSIEQRWSFSSILNNLSLDNEIYDKLIGLNYSYSFSSHFIHQDAECLKIKQANMVMCGKNNYSADKAHAVRIISNILFLALLRIDIYIKKYGLKYSDYSEKITKIYKYIEDIERINNELIENF